MRLSPCLAYGTQVVSEPAEFSEIGVSSIVSLREDHSKSYTSRAFLGRVAYFAEKKMALLKILESHILESGALPESFVKSHSMC